MGRNPMVLTAIEGLSVNSGFHKIICMIDGEISIDVCVCMCSYTL